MPTSAGRQEVAHHRLVAETAADVGQQRLAVAVGEVARVARQLAQVGQAVVDRGVADPHRRQRIDAALREVLGHAFHEPQRQLLEVEAAPAVASAMAGDVVLEDVHDLVAEDVIVLRVVAGQRQDDAVHERVGEAAGALRRSISPVVVVCWKSAELA